MILAVELTDVLNKGGYTLIELMKAGFTADEIAAGLKALKKAGTYSAAQAKKAGFTATELKEAKYTFWQKICFLIL